MRLLYLTAEQWPTFRPDVLALFGSYLPRHGIHSDLATERAHGAPGPEEQFIVRRSLEQALNALNEREQRVIQMIYEFELSYKEIAAVLDLSDARVCQLNKSALTKMKAALAQA